MTPAEAGFSIYISEHSDPFGNEFFKPTTQSLTLSQGEKIHARYLQV